MPIAFGAAGTRLLVGTAATTWNVAYPASVAADDLLVLEIATNGGAVTTPSGWTAVYNETVLSNPKGGLFIKKAAGGESGTLAVTVGSTTGNAQMFRYTGVDPTTPQDATATTGSSSANTDPIVHAAITTVTAGTWLVYAAAVNSSSTNVTTEPAGSTIRVDHADIGGTGTKGGYLIDEGPITGTGSTGTRTVDMNAARAYWGAMMALRPASGGGSPITATPGGIASAEAFGTAVALAVLIATPTGIPSAEAFGTPTEVVTLISTPTGIPTAESFGTPTVVATLTAVPTGIPTGEALGAPTATVQTPAAQPTGIPSAEALGSPTALSTLLVTPTGISSQEAFGTPTELATLTAVPGGIASAETFGSPTAVPVLTVIPTGISSGEAFGTATVQSGYTATPTGIASAETFGTPTEVATLTVTPTGISSAESFGTPTELATLTVTPGGIASAEAFGTPTETATLTAVPTGIGSGEAFGNPVNVGASAVLPTGIPSAEAFGTPTRLATLTVIPTGIPSAQAFGTPSVDVTFRSIPTGISSAEEFGLPLILTGAENLSNWTWELTPQGVRWTLAGQDQRYTLTEQENRFSLSALSVYELQAEAPRWALHGIEGEEMIIEILASAGAQQYVGGTITEKTGKDISAITITMTLGSERHPGSTWEAPDEDESGPVESRYVLKMVGASENTAAGTYHMWVKLGEGPEATVMRFPQKVIVR